jgi:hypothetical protein
MRKMFTSGRTTYSKIKKCLNVNKEPNIVGK